MENAKLKEECINLYLKGNTYMKIAQMTGFSRTFITNLIKDDERVITKKNHKKLKVFKRKDNKQMVIYIPTNYLKKLGISNDIKKVEYVDVSIDEEHKTIIIKKHM